MNELVIHPRLRMLSLFSGIGGIDLGLRQWCQTVCYCEIDPYACGVLIKNMAEGNLDVAPIWSDVTTLGAAELAAIGPIDIIAGGFPCQDLSYAGKGAGIIEGQTRSGLFYEIIRLIRLVRPRFIFLENVPAILTRGLDAVLGNLAACGYDAIWKVLSAAEVGASHRRDRWWCLGYACQCGCPGDNGRGAGEILADGCTQLADANSGRHLYRQLSQQPAEGRLDALGQFVPGSPDVRHPQGLGLEGERSQRLMRSDWRPTQSSLGMLADGIPGRLGEFGGWEVEPDIPRVAKGIENRAEQLKCYGNAVVHQCVEAVFPLLMANL